MRRLFLPVFLLLCLVLAGCSSSEPEAKSQFGSRIGTSGPAGDAMPGTPEWYAWVDKTLDIKPPGEGGPEAGSDAWNRAVQQKLGPHPPAFPLGSKLWQSAVDGMVRTRPSKS